MKCYAVRRRWDGEYLTRHYGRYSSFSPFKTKFFSLLKGAKSCVMRYEHFKEYEVVEFELTETKIYEV